MSSLRRILSSRANGARSRGPLTPESQRRSSQNALRHRLLARCVVLPGESVDSFQQLLAQHIERFAPFDGVEFGMIEEMASAYWRLRRAWAIENNLLAEALAAQPAGSRIASPPNLLSSIAMRHASTSCINARCTTSCSCAPLGYQTNGNYALDSEEYGAHTICRL